MVCSRGIPQLVVLAPDSDRARRIELRPGYMVVGREPGCDVRFDDPHVSRSHAALQRSGNAVYVRDLGSCGGTFIGGTAVTAARQLHPGDVVTFATAAIGPTVPLSSPTVPPQRWPARTWRLSARSPWREPWRCGSAGSAFWSLPKAS